MTNNNKPRQLLLFPDYKDPPNLTEEVYRFVHQARPYLNGFLERNSHVTVISLGVRSGPYGLALATQLIKNKGYAVESMQIECGPGCGIRGLRGKKLKGRGVIIVDDGQTACEKVRRLKDAKPRYIAEICYLSHWPDSFEEFRDAEKVPCDVQLTTR